MGRPVKGRYVAANGRQGVPAEKIEDYKKPDQTAQGLMRCSTCNRSYPPDARWRELWKDGRCWFCLHGIVLK